MSNKRYSNKGVNSAAKAQANAAAAQENKRQTLIICAVAAAVILLAIILAVALGGSDATIGGDKETTAGTGQSTTTGTSSTTTSSATTSSTPSNADMTAIQAEIDSMKVVDFTETTETTEYVMVSIKHFGDVVIRLRSDIAPITVENFQKLVGKGFYNGLTFHRIMKGFMIQGGDPQGDGKGGSDTTIKGEFEINGIQNDLSHVAGVISMARKNMPYDSATSQFFICNADASASLDGKYAGFGYVVAGLDVVLTVSEVEVEANDNGENSAPVEPIVIEKICFVTKNAE
jgi:peptidyl-prolyl cis-trans isomerase B (cyclophilin B)